MGKDFTYKQQFGVIAIVENEKEQKKLYEKLVAQGLMVKVVVV